MVVHSGGRASGFRNRWVGLGERLGWGLARPLPAGLQGTHGGAQWWQGQWLQEQVGGVRGGVKAGLNEEAKLGLGRLVQIPVPRLHAVTCKLIPPSLPPSLPPLPPSLPPTQG